VKKRAVYAKPAMDPTQMLRRRKTGTSVNGAVYGHTSHVATWTQDTLSVLTVGKVIDC